MMHRLKNRFRRGSIAPKLKHMTVKQADGARDSEAGSRTGVGCKPRSALAFGGPKGHCRKELSRMKVSKMEVGTL